LDVTRRDVESALRALSDPSTTGVRSMRQAFSKRLALAPARDVIALATELATSGNGTERFVGYELVLHHPAAHAAVNERVARVLGAGMSDWAAVDTFACYVAGPAWRNGQITDSVVRRWVGSRDRWWRRAAVVCTVALNNAARGGSGDTKRTLDICRLARDDRDDMVVKALSWALRELSKRDAAAVRSFIALHHDRLAPRVLREVRHKLTTGLKSARRSADT